MLPVHLGLQAPWTTSNKRHLIDPVRAAEQGRTSADAAVAAIGGLGLPRSSTVFFDKVAYAIDNASCTRAVSFLGAWNPAKTQAVAT